jgi:hypothetical protein
LGTAGYGNHAGNGARFDRPISATRARWSATRLSQQQEQCAASVDVRKNIHRLKSDSLGFDAPAAAVRILLCSRTIADDRQASLSGPPKSIDDDLYRLYGTERDRVK